MGTARVLAIVFGEDDAYTIWFLTGYNYRAEFKDGYTETGSYSVKDGKLALKNRAGEKRTIGEAWTMAFGGRTAELVRADFSDSKRIVGEFDVNENGLLEIRNADGAALKLSSIRKKIDNTCAFDILKAILPDEAE